MGSHVLRTVRCVALLIGIGLIQTVLPQAAAQSDASSNVQGNVYTSPTFGYSMSWDEQVWQVSLEYASLTLDYLVLQSTEATVSVEWLYSYDGDADACMDWERHRLAQDQGLTALTPLLDASGAAREAVSPGRTLGFYALPISEQDATLANTVYLECETVVPGSVVMIVTGFIDPPESPAMEEAILKLSDAIQPGPNGVPPLDLVAFENGIWLTADNIDAFWTDVFAGMNIDYAPPTYQVVTFPIQLDCNNSTTEETRALYCPTDLTVYLDVGQFNDYLNTYGQAGIEAAMGHEVGHHVQNLRCLGGFPDVGCGPEADPVSIELQADCLAGVWLQSAFTTGFFDERAEYRFVASVKNWRESMGDAQGNYGSGEEHSAAFMAGYEGGITACGFE